MKLWSEFTAAIGYKGLLLFIDEGVNLYKITNSVSRQSNYEKLLTMFNDTMQGKAEHLGIYMGGTPQFVEDERRGLFSYDALRSRLIDGRYGSSSLRTYTSPILKLDMLSYEEILILLQKLRDIHALHFKYEAQLTDDQLIAFMQTAVNRLGAEELLTTREVVRDFMDMLHTLHQHPEAAFEELLGERAAAQPQGKGKAMTIRTIWTICWRSLNYERESFSRLAPFIQEFIYKKMGHPSRSAGGSLPRPVRYAPSSVDRFRHGIGQDRSRILPGADGAVQRAFEFGRDPVYRAAQGAD